jgi:predicted phosphodiesterase
MKVIMIAPLIVISPILLIPFERASQAHPSSSGEVEIINGPYLLGVTDQSVKIVWETDGTAEFKVQYGVPDSEYVTVEPIFRKGSAWRDLFPEGINLYEGYLSELHADTRYHYRISSGSTSFDGSFRTLPRIEEFKFALVTDTHLFEIAEEFTKRMSEFEPHVIVHGGDIPEGYGFQYDQFVNYWFRPLRTLLGRIPVFYSRGNHDVGAFWDDFFGTQAVGLPNYGGTSLHPRPWYSFGVGNAHFVVIDSNQFSPVVLADFQEQHDWLIKDLESESCRNALWRFVVSHHPYSVATAREYIVPIMERYGIDIWFGGHTHAYSKAVSLNPETGSRSLYIEVGDGKFASGRVEAPPGSTREGYPNVVAFGRADYATVEVGGDTLRFRIHTTLPGEGEGTTGILDEFVLSKDEPELEYADLEVFPGSIRAGESVTVKLRVKNVGRGLAAVPVRILDREEEVWKYVLGSGERGRVVVLKPGESEEIEMSLALYDPGIRRVQVADFQPVVVDVAPQAPGFVYENLRIDMGSGSDSNIARITATVRNVGSFSGSTDAKVYVDGEEVSTRGIALGPGRQESLTFFHEFRESGSYRVGLGDLDPVTVEIQGALALTPIVPDLSGQGNHGIIRGSPRWVTGIVGRALEFDGVNDYVEVPDSETLHVRDAFTAVVWSNIRSLDTTKNHAAALLAKGPSTGWGPTYLIRMIFRGTGGFTSGTTYGGVEFAWEGGWLNPEDMGGWRQYVSTYDGETSTGTSYIDLTRVAEAMGGGLPLNHWEGYPILSGLAYAGYIDPQSGRGARPFLLSGTVDEIRFYNTHLSEAERSEIYHNPERLGPKNENLVLWLSFDEVETFGKHITEWRRPISFVPSYVGEKKTWTWKNLKVEAHVPDGSEIYARVESSDDGETVKDSLELLLNDGVIHRDLSGLRPAQYVRMWTELKSRVNGGVIPLPKVHKYVATAAVRGAETEMVWSTRADWERGESTGAIGFLPVDRLRPLD